MWKPLCAGFQRENRLCSVMKKPKTDKDAEEKEKKARRKKMEEVAKYLRFNVSCKNAVIRGQKIEYFTGSKAVDCLMASKWTAVPRTEDDYTPYFASRSDAVAYCVNLLKNDFFVRANKVEVKPKADTKGEGGEKGGRREAESVKRKEGKITDSSKTRKQEQQGEDGKKKKKKFRLETHQQQSFFDTDDVYYWQFDPPSSSTYLIGLAVVLGAIAVTLQPLWPDSTRVGVWYLSMALFVIIGALLVVIVVRWFLFGLITVFTMGKVQFWILPNLENEKCGFFASFMPLYSIERRSKSKKGSKKKKVSENSNEPKDESEKMHEEESDASASDREEEGDFNEPETNTQSSS